MKRTNHEENDVRRDAEILLESIAQTAGILRARTDEYNAAAAELAARYDSDIAALKADLETDEKAICALMKRNRRILFDGTDVVNLPTGSLIRRAGIKIVIPKTALAECEKQGFSDVIKVVKSLDRDAIEKWPDAKLVLIGAERKPKEEFEYSVK